MLTYAAYVALLSSVVSAVPPDCHFNPIKLPSTFKLAAFYNATGDPIWLKAVSQGCNGGAILLPDSDFDSGSLFGYDANSSPGLFSVTLPQSGLGSDTRYAAPLEPGNPFQFFDFRPLSGANDTASPYVSDGTCTPRTDKWVAGSAKPSPYPEGALVWSLCQVPGYPKGLRQLVYGQESGCEAVYLKPRISETSPP